MSDFVDEKKRPLPSEQTRPMATEFGVAPTPENAEQKSEQEPTKREQSPVVETAAKMKELFSFKRKPHKPIIPVTRDPVSIKVEKILEEGLGDAYSRLSPIAQQEFKLRGEDTAQKIALLLKSTHVKVKKIFKLILEWLRMLPGINRFFLEQEAKIKADRILSLHEDKNKT